MNRTAALEKIDNIKKQLIEKYKPEKIILFGSSVPFIKKIYKEGKVLYG